MVDRLDKGDVVRVRDEPVLSVVVLPSYCQPDPADLPDNMPPIEVCCVPVALVRTKVSGFAGWISSTCGLSPSGDTMFDRQ